MYLIGKYGFPSERLIGSSSAFNAYIMMLHMDKDLDNILKEIVEEADTIIMTRSKNPRAATPEDLCQRTEKLCGKRSEIADSVQDALTAAKQIATREDLICITGSAYVAGEARQALDL